MFSEGIRFLALDIAKNMDALLRPGQRFQAVVQGTASRAFLTLGNAKIPLDLAALNLTPGQAVAVEVGQTEAGLQLQLSPQSASASATASATGALRGMLSGILEGMGALERLAMAQKLTPPQWLDQPAGLRPLMNLFFASNTLATDMQTLTALLEQAGREGLLRPEQLKAFQDLNRLFSADSSSDFQRLLQILADQRGLHAQIARSPRQGKGFKMWQDLVRAQLAQLKNDNALRQHLQSRGQLRTFERASQNVLERFTAVDTQNARVPEAAYHFLEIPFLPGGEITRAQLHFFGEGGGKGGKAKGQVQVAMDLSTTRLGDLWVTLQIASGHCQCYFRATRPEVAASIEEHAEELQSALRKAGYADAAVSAILWDGDSLRETAALMQRFDSIEFEV